MADKKKTCQACGAKCCRYVTLDIDEPEDIEDFDNLRWYVSHKGCAVYREDGKWHFEVLTACEHLSKDGTCKIYPRRPEACRDHDPDSCVYSAGEFAWDFGLETIEDVEDYARLALRSSKRRNGKFNPPWDKKAKA